jgi:hypothetical protein
MPRVSEFFHMTSTCDASQRQVHHVAVCSNVTQQAENYPNFISTITTGDESLVYGYDPEKQQQSSMTKWLSSGDEFRELSGTPYML